MYRMFYLINKHYLHVDFRVQEILFVCHTKINIKNLHKQQLKRLINMSKQLPNVSDYRFIKHYSPGKHLLVANDNCNFARTAL